MATGRPQEDRPKGILLMIAAVSCFALLDATAKYLQTVLPAEQVIWARFVGQLVIAAALLAWPPAGTWRSGNLKLQLLRSVFLAASTILNFRALHFLQLDVTTSIQFATPLIVTALAVPLLGERVGWRRWTAILVGFCGVLVIVNPTDIHAHWAVLLAVGTTVTSALYLITTRMLAGDDAHTTHLYTPLVGALAMTP
ncbi:MAG: DMT family transporter, partial [Alphaproteobacteria bacterium]|nr:DMT family transporter [Alphaproteobacteria bacterium]